MDFQYSKVVDTYEYDPAGLCEGIHLRMHKDSVSEINGALRCQRDWSKHVSPVIDYHDTLGTPFSFIRVCIPETLPERLEIVSYANEFAFIYDDIVMENLDQKFSSRDRFDILDEFGGEITNNPQQSKATRLKGVKDIQAQILEEMMKIDEERGRTTMKSWQKFISVVSTRQRSEPFGGINEYLPYRISDAGELFWFGLITFAMGLTIPSEEMVLSKSLAYSAWKALALTNDLYSWEKERVEASRSGQVEVVNAIWILMCEHSITELEAKELCREKIKSSVADAVRTANETRLRSDLSLDLRKYIDAITYSISGNLVWSIYCPRYHYYRNLD